MWIAFLIGIIALIALGISEQQGLNLIGGGYQMLGRFINLSLDSVEQSIILQQAQSHSIDPRLLAALRLVENGGPGREFGVMDPSADTYSLQASYAANTIRNTIGRYEANVGLSVMEDGQYTYDFLLYFSGGGPGYSGYAPLGAANDPTGLNYNHFPNLLAKYNDIEMAIG